jgi:hypothetical protein
VISPSQRPLPTQDNTTYKHKRQTSMPRAVFEPAIPAIKRPQTYALDRAATGIGMSVNSSLNFIFKVISSLHTPTHTPTHPHTPHTHTHTHTHPHTSAFHVVENYNQRIKMQYYIPNKQSRDSFCCKEITCLLRTLCVSVLGNFDEKNVNIVK